MADEKKLNVDMEEYSIPEEGGGSSEYNEQLTPASESTVKKSGRAKRLLIPVILVVAIIVFYQILNWFSHRESQKGIKEEQEVARKTQQSIIAAQQPVKTTEVTPALTETTTISPVEAKTTTQPLQSKASTETALINYDKNIQNKLQILANRTESNSQQLDKLQSSLLRSQAALIVLNRTISDLSASIQDITRQIQSLNALKPKPKPIKKIVKLKPPKEIYHVKAIVPGLVWLESANGKIVSVRVGDSLEGYGVVQMISPQQGMVITSNGSVIQYGVNDF